jgi:two-component system NarL family sensor kinase
MTGFRRLRGEIDFPLMNDRRSQELSILNDVARALNASVDLPALLARALEKVAELLGLSTGWVLLFEEASGAPFLAAAQNLPPGFQQDPRLMAGWCYCLESFRDGEMDGAENVGVVWCSRLRKLALAKGKTAGLRFHASVPLTVFSGEDRDSGLKRLGILNVAGPEWRELDEDELNLLHTIGDMLGVAVERARLHARRLEAVQTEERNRLAREIHDTIAQDLSAITFQLEAAEALLGQEAEPERVQRSVSAALGLARKGLEEARRSVLDLRAAPLEGRTLPAALASLAAESEDGGSPSVAFEAVPAVPPPLPPAIEVGLYRIAQEALQNALRHAAASRVMLRLEVADETVRLTVEDDGRGFAIGNTAEGPAASRFGLVGMRERARLLGGSFQVESSPGAGTRITAEAPLARPPIQ